MIAKPLPLPPLGLPYGQRIYAIGDVHGQAERLTRLYDLILADLASSPVRSPVILYVGDLIDRGPDSAGVLAHVLNTRSRLPTVTLLGNHEAMLLDTLATPDRARGAKRAEHWLGHGGEATLQSWGVPARAPVAQWAAHIPPAALALLRSMRLHWLAGECLFVHAGVRPGVAWAAQERVDLLYMREPFLRWRSPPLPDAPAWFVVHGHTPGPRPVLTRRRLCIDTGAGLGGPLTCAVIARDTVRYLQA